MVSLIEKNINSPLVSSTGRLFDAVASILGLNYYSTYQAEAPMLLESAIDHSERGMYSYSLEGTEVFFTSLIKEVVKDVQNGLSAGRISARFHHTLVHMVRELALDLRERTGLDRVVLAGGSFQNCFLCESTINLLEKEGLKVFIPRRIPPNDQGISVGQVAIGAHRKKML